ncbi:response regulator [Nocardioides coralli]|uniref:response regulator n=1 Tax=Nocardioides coralli TaxID=2872154 RepID=UPI001CA3E638|nr:response regulator [Nocardioides coralli]QZY30081.1 response regulator [Nocardioides coralli]
MSSRRVMVVDDDESIRMVASVALESIGGWQVLSADSGQACLAMAPGPGIDAILLDVMMPGLDGLTTFRLLQADPATRDIPVVLVTAKLAYGEHPDWEGLAVAGVIAKPFDPMTLAREVGDLLGWND